VGRSGLGQCGRPLSAARDGSTGSVVISRNDEKRWRGGAARRRAGCRWLRSSEEVSTAGAADRCRGDVPPGKCCRASRVPASRQPTRLPDPLSDDAATGAQAYTAATRLPLRSGSGCRRAGELPIATMARLDVRIEPSPSSAPTPDPAPSPSSCPAGRRSDESHRRGRSARPGIPDPTDGRYPDGRAADALVSRPAKPRKRLRRTPRPRLERVRPHLRLRLPCSRHARPRPRVRPRTGPPPSNGLPALRRVNNLPAPVLGNVPRAVPDVVCR